MPSASANLTKKETLAQKRARAVEIFNRLEEKYPDVTTFLTHNNPFELLIAVILSAQCTDEMVNRVTPNLFEKYPTPTALANGDINDITQTIRSINYFRNKAINIQKTAQLLLDNFGGTVPNTLNELITLAGVGRKTANVVLGQAFDTPGITVDTHVGRVSRRLGFTPHTDAVKIEQDLMKIWPKSTWIILSSTTILHGRHTCNARKPKCEGCILEDLCARIGVK